MNERLDHSQSEAIKIAQDITKGHDGFTAQATMEWVTMSPKEMGEKQAFSSLVLMAEKADDVPGIHEMTALDAHLIEGGAMTLLKACQELGVEMDMEFFGIVAMNCVLIGMALQAEMENKRGE